MTDSVSPRRINALAAAIALVAALVAALAGPRPAAAQLVRDSAGPAPLRSGEMFDQLARMDSLLFDYGFVSCDAEAADTLVTRDVEFYDDRGGLSVGDAVRESFRSLAGNCPAGNGVRRVLLKGSLEVYPLEGVGAVQMGIHHFVEKGASTSLIARFIHTWKRVDGNWKLARIISIHEKVDAARAARLRALAGQGSR